MERVETVYNQLVSLSNSIGSSLNSSAKEGVPTLIQLQLETLKEMGRLASILDTSDEIENERERDLIDFGTYLKSPERYNSVKDERLLNVVTDADLANFKIFKALKLRGGSGVSVGDEMGSVNPMNPN